MPFVVSKAILLASAGLVFHKYLEQHELIVYKDESLAATLTRSILVCSNGPNQTVVLDLPFHDFSRIDSTTTCPVILPYIHCLSHVKISPHTVDIYSGPLDHRSLNDISSSLNCVDATCEQCVDDVSAALAASGYPITNRNSLGLQRSWFLGFDESTNMLPIIGAHTASIFPEQFRIVDSFLIPSQLSISINKDFILHGVEKIANPIHVTHASGNHYSETFNAVLPCFNIANLLTQSDMVPYYVETGFNVENQVLSHVVDKCGLRDHIHRVGTRKVTLSQWNHLKNAHDINYRGSLCSVVDIYYAMNDEEISSLDTGNIICLEGFLANLARMKGNNDSATLVYLSDFQLNFLDEADEMVEQMNILQAISSFISRAHDHTFSKLSIVSISTHSRNAHNDQHLHDVYQISELLYDLLHSQADATTIKKYQDKIIDHIERILIFKNISRSADIYFLGLLMSHILLDTLNEFVHQGVGRQREKIWTIMDPIVKLLFSSIPQSIQNRKEALLTELTADLLEGSLNPITFEHQSEVADYLAHQATQLGTINTHDHKSHILLFIHPSELMTARNIVQVWKEKCLQLACHFYVKPIIIQLPYESEIQKRHGSSTGSDSVDVCDAESPIPSVRFALRKARQHLLLSLQDVEVAVILIGMQSILTFISQGSDYQRGVIPSAKFMGTASYNHSHPLLSSLHHESGLSIAGLVGSICQFIDQVLIHPLYPIATDRLLITMIQQYLSTYRNFVHFDKEMKYFDSENISKFCNRQQLSLAGNGNHNTLSILGFDRTVNDSYRSFGFVYWPPIILTLQEHPPKRTLNTTLLNEKTGYALTAMKQHCLILLTTYLALSLYQEISQFRSDHLSSIDPSVPWSWSWPFSIGLLNSVSIFLHLCPSSHATLDETLETLELLKSFEKEMIAPPFSSKPQHIDLQLVYLLLSSLCFEIGSLNLAVTHYYSTLPLLMYAEVQDGIENWRGVKQRDHSKSPFHRNNFTTHYVTYATASTPALESLVESSIVADINITVLGIGKEFTSYYQKWEDGYAPHLMQLPDDDFAVLMDAYDSIVFPTLKNISNVILSSPAPIMFCSEFEAYPDYSAAYAYPSVSKRDVRRRQLKQKNVPKFLNSGCIAGRVGNLKEMWRLTSPHMTVLRDDQQALAKFYLAYPHMATLDTGSVMTTGYRKNCSDDACSAISVTRKMNQEGTEQLEFAWGDVSGIGLVHFNQKGRSKAFNRTAAFVREFYQSQRLKHEDDILKEH